MMSNVSCAERDLKDKEPENFVTATEVRGLLHKMVHFLWQSGKSAYEHVWPVSFLLSNFLAHWRYFYF